MKHKLQEYFTKYKVQGITFDSRTIQAGDAFFAIKGGNFDGNNYIDEALKAGASIIFTDNSLLDREDVIYLEDIKLSLAIASGLIYKKLPTNLLAVTGTNGKSSVVSYVNQILNLLGEASASIGTLGIESSKKLPSKLLNSYPKSFTTADPVHFRQVLNDLANYGIINIAFEASSHGLYQKRLGDIKIKTAGFTSFSQDHLEYHKTLEEYLRAKLILFTEHLEINGEAVINSDIMFCDFIKKFFSDQKINYTTVGTKGDIQVKSIKPSLKGQVIVYKFGGKVYEFKTNIIGSFQAINILIAAKLVTNLGHCFDKISQMLCKLSAVLGRLERITNKDSEFQIFVDYAHTPDALEKSLLELKKLKLKNSQLYVIFGCGGNRDPIKRPIMGSIAKNIADVVVITDDNPRNENPASIRAEIIAGIGDDAIEIADREEAINHAMAKLKKGDILLIAGKGHENYQVVREQTKYFSDVETVRNMLKERNN